MESVNFKYKIGSKVWIYLAGEVTRMVVNHRESVVTNNGDTLILYHLTEYSKEMSTWIWPEHSIFKTKKEIFERLKLEEEVKNTI